MDDIDRWHVLYHDGTECNEEDTSGDVVRLRGWAEIDHAQVALLQIRQDDMVVASVLIPDGAIPVLFRRRTIEIRTDGETAQEQGRTTVSVIGWRSEYGECWLWRNPETGVVVLSAGEITG